MKTVKVQLDPSDAQISVLFKAASEYTMIANDIVQRVKAIDKMPFINYKSINSKFLPTKIRDCLVRDVQFRHKRGGKSLGLIMAPRFRMNSQCYKIENGRIIFSLVNEKTKELSRHKIKIVSNSEFEEYLNSGKPGSMEITCDGGGWSAVFFNHAGGGEKNEISAEAGETVQ